MRKVIAWLLVLTLTVAVSIGATLAYLTDTDEDVNVMTLGNVKIEQLEYERIDTETTDDEATVQQFHDNKPLYPAVTKDGFAYTPGDAYVDWEQIDKEDYASDIWNPDKINNEVDKMVFVKNKGDYDAYVRSVIAFEAGRYQTVDAFRSMVHLNLNESDWSWEWIETPVSIGGSTYFVAVATYNRVLEPGKLTEISLSQLALDSSATNEDVAAFGETYNVLVKSQGIQAQGFENAKAALDEGFGSITAVNVPFETDQPIQGLSIRNALHYLNGNTAGTKITTKVTNVVFGRNKDYPEITEGYEGMLVTDGQDVDVYAYYVPGANGTYDVYFLSDSKIYAPGDSTELFYKMSALKTVETGNLDVSRTKNMYRMFSYCTALQKLDVSHFDVSHAVNMEHAFSHLEVLEELDVSNWQPSSAETMRYMFGYNYKLKELDVSDWDTSSLTNTMMMFRDCDTLTEVDASGWDTAKLVEASYTFAQCDRLKTVNATGWDTGAVNTTKAMFQKCKSLETVVGIENWEMPNNTSLYFMFQECYPMKQINVSGWNTGNVTDMNGVFYKCTSLETVEGLGNWDTSKVTNMAQLFEACAKLENIEGIGNFDTANVEDMTHMFTGCHSLKELDVSRWDTGKVVSFRDMFGASTQNTGAMQIAQLDVSNWDTSSATDMAYMFYGCGQITELDLSNWDVSNVTDMYHMFTDCIKMEHYDFTGWDTSKVTDINGMFNSNRALKSVDLSSFDTQNIVDFAQLFDGASSLETVIGMDQWDTSSAQCFSEMFTGTQVSEVDLSSFDMSNVLYTDSMFSGNSKLTTIYVGDNWNLDPARLLEAGNMFGGCGSLVGANGTTTAGNPTNATYARVDTPETPGYLTYKAAPKA